MSSQNVILVVEDEPALVGIYQRALEHEGYLVLTAGNGREALAILDEKGGEIDLLLSDIVMPGIGGRELVWRIKETLPQIKVILASGYTDAEGALQMMEDHGVSFVEKPVNLNALMRMVKDVLSSNLSSLEPESS